MYLKGTKHVFNAALGSSHISINALSMLAPGYVQGKISTIFFKNSKKGHDIKILINKCEIYFK